MRALVEAWLIVALVVTAVVALVMLIAYDVEAPSAGWAALGLGAVVAVAIVAALLVR